MKNRKHLDDNYDCASARLVRMLKCVKKSICDLCMSALMNGVRVCVCDLMMWQSGSKLTPVPYEKAQTSEEKIYMQAVRSSRQRQSGSNIHMRARS